VRILDDVIGETFSAPRETRKEKTIFGKLYYYRCSVQQLAERSMSD